MHSLRDLRDLRRVLTMVTGSGQVFKACPHFSQLSTQSTQWLLTLRISTWQICMSKQKRNNDSTKVWFLESLNLTLPGYECEEPKTNILQFLHPFLDPLLDPSILLYLAMSSIKA